MSGSSSSSSSTSTAASGMKRLQGKVAIITGGASGIGEATARHFAAHGAKAIVIADVQRDRGLCVAKSISSSVSGCDCSYVQCDVSDEEQVKSLVESTVGRHGRVDVMFSNAGIGSASACDQSIMELDVAGMDALFAVNVRGMAACVKHAARAMAEGGGGSIICTASVTGSIGTDKGTDYTMSKHAVLGLVRCGSKQLGPHGIRVNSISPSAVPTPMSCNLLGIDEEQFQRYYESSSSMEGVLKLKHVADAALFLASNESEFVNGHNLAVDGGYIYKSR